MKLNPSIKVSLVASGVALLAYVGYWSYSESQLSSFNPVPIAPGNVNLVAFKTSGNLRIRVANRIANLVELDPNAQTGPGNEEQARDDSSDVDARRIPIREFLQSLQGNEKALSSFVTTLNRLDTDGLIPPQAAVWKASDLQKALDGDKELEKNLVRDIHINLDGTPLPTVDLAAIRNGIVIELPVPVKVNVGNKAEVLTATIKEPYQPRFCIEYAKTIERMFDPPQSTIIGNYTDLAKPILEGKNTPENVRQSIQKLIDDAKKQELAAKPERLLQGAQVLVTDDLFEGASSSEYRDDRGKELFDLNIKVNEEGRKRLWKYSRDTKGFELLLVVDGIAVAAPRITTELSGRDVTIKRLQEKSLVDKAVETIQEAAKGQKSS